MRNSKINSNSICNITFLCFSIDGLDRCQLLSSTRISRTILRSRLIKRKEKGTNGHKFVSALLFIYSAFLVPSLQIQRTIYYTLLPFKTQEEHVCV